MTAPQRRASAVSFMRSMRKELPTEEWGVLKTDIIQAVNALDSWVNTNANTINQAIPQPARSGLSTRQKALLFMYVVRQRFLTEA